MFIPPTERSHWEDLEVVFQGASRATRIKQDSAARRQVLPLMRMARMQVKRHGKRGKRIHCPSINVSPQTLKEAPPRLLPYLAT